MSRARQRNDPVADCLLAGLLVGKVQSGRTFLRITLGEEPDLESFPVASVLVESFRMGVLISAIPWSADHSTGQANTVSIAATSFSRSLPADGRPFGCQAVGGGTRHGARIMRNQADRQGGEHRIQQAGRGGEAERIVPHAAPAVFTPW